MVDNQRMIPAPAHGNDIRQLALEALCAANPDRKTALALVLYTQLATLTIANQILPDPHIPLPGRPAQPALTHPAKVPRRSPLTLDGRAAMVHAICHIEFNAINLALDAIWRFGGMPRSYYLDWLTVAAEEAHHFSLLRAHLQSLGYDYGDFPAHTGLWDMTEKTKGDVLARMALLPRTLEARGLDATPPMQAKLRKVGSAQALKAVDILDVILRDEIGHVAIGNHWYRHLCTQRGLEPLAHYAVLARQYGAPSIKGPLNLEARRKAGFEEAELALLDG